MTTKKRRQFSPEQKMAILQRHLLEHVPVSDLCDEYQLQPTVFCAWQKQLFENGGVAELMEEHLRLINHLGMCRLEVGGSGPP